MGFPNNSMGGVLRFAGGITEAARNQPGLTAKLCAASGGALVVQKGLR